LKTWENLQIPRQSHDKANECLGLCIGITSRTRVHQEAGLQLHLTNAAGVKKEQKFKAHVMLSIQKPYKIRGSQVNLALDPTSSYNCYWIPSLIGISRQKFFGLLYCFPNPYRKLQRRPIDDVCISRMSSQDDLRRANTYNTSASSAIPTSSLRVPFHHRFMDTTVHASASNILLGIL